MKKIIGFDYLRSIAVFSVVWIHSCYTDNIMKEFSLYCNYYAVPCFILMSIFLLGYKLEKKKDNLIKKYLFRLLPQYVFWTIIYLIIKYIKYLFIDDETFNITFSILFLGRSSIHLWFIPAIFIWYCFMFFYYKIENILVDFFFAILSFFVGFYSFSNEYFTNSFISLFVLHTGYIFCSKIIFQYKDRIKNAPSSIYLLFFIITFVLRIWANSPVFDVAYTLSLFLFFLSFNPSKESKTIKSISKYSFGIYLSHFVFIQLMVAGTPFLDIEIEKPLINLIIIIGSFICAYGTSCIFDKNYYMRKFI